MTQRLFPSFEPEGLREARLIFMAPEKPKERSGEVMRENLETLGPRYHEVITQLRDAASYAGDANLAKLLEDPETKQMIAAQVELPEGNLTKKWLNTIALVFLRKAHEAFKSEEGEVRGWKDKTTEQAKKCAEIFRTTLSEIEAAKKTYGEELPGFGGDEGRALLELLRRGADQPKLKEKFDRLLDLQKEILWADDASLVDEAGKSTNTQKWKNALKAVGVADSALDEVDTTIDSTARRKLLLKLVRGSAGVLSASEQGAVRGAIGKIDEALTGVDDERKTHLMGHFPERLKYLYRLGGSDMDAVVENAIGRDNMFSFSILEENLRILMGAKLEDKNRKELLGILGLSSDAERKIVSADALTKAAEYLRATLKLNNPTGISLSALAFRARLPEPMADELSESKLQIGLGTLIDVTAKLDAVAPGRISDPVQQYLESVLFETKQINGADRKVLKNKAKFLEVVSFLHYGDGANPLERGTKAGEAAEKFWNDHLKALIETIDGTGVVKIGSEAALTTALKTLQVSAQAAQWHKSMRDGGVHELTWKKSASQYASALGTTMAAAAPLWWDYIKSIPRNFWDSEGDQDLLKILNRRKALEKGKAALESLLTTSNGAADLLQKSEIGLGYLKAAQEQAISGDAVTSPRDNIEQARALLMANQYVIGQLNTLGWNMRSKRLRQLTLWMAMFKGTKKDPEAGLEAAKKLLQESGNLRTPEEQDAFVDAQMAKMSAADRKAFLQYTDARALVENQEGRDTLSPLRQRGLILSPRALDILRQAKDPANPALNLAANVGRWLMDPPETVQGSLQIALEDGDAKTAFITAFVTGEEQTYAHQGRTEKVSVTDARMAVDVLQQRLLFEMRGTVTAREQIEDEEEFTNPIDRWLRTGLESMKELWNTDMVGKAEVIAILFAAYWMIKEAWKSKKGKFVLLGLPILLGANAIIKQRTGRDLLGENLRWKNKEDRASPLEAFRRRGAALDARYKILMQPSGQAAIRVLMNEKNPVKVEELLAWRDAVKAGGGRKFSVGVPPTLRVTDIEDTLGATGSREKAYEVAYLAFEALCADVGRLNGLTGGNTDTNAERGADLIRRRYVQNRSAELTPATMFEVIMSESQMPTLEMLQNRSYLEAVADLFGYTYTEAAALVKKYGTQAWVMMKQGVHKVPEVAGAAVEYAGAGWDAFRNWAALTWAKGKPEMAESISALWRFLRTTTVAGGMTLVSVTPDAATWAIDKSIFVAKGGRDVALATYRTLLRNGITGPIIDSFVREVAAVTGFDIDKLWSTPEHKEKLADFEDFLVALEKQVSTVAELPPAPEHYFAELVKGITGSVTDGGPEKARDRLLTYELARRQVFSFLAAERIHAIKNLKGKPPADLHLTLPLRVSWPADAKKFHEVNRADEIYLYLHDNYDLPVMLAALGNQQTFIGLMKLFAEQRPKMLRSQIFDWLLWPGIHEYVARDDAGAFLISQWQSYVGDLLQNAERELPPDAFRRYQAYVRTLLTNVMAEVILDTDKKPADLKLLKSQAKEFYRNLLMRRGTLDSHTEAAKGKTELYNQFDVPGANPNVPAELLDTAGDKDLRWVLLGETPPESASTVPAASAAPAPAPPPLVQTDIDRLRANLDGILTNPAVRKDYLTKLTQPGIGPLENDIRAKFDALPPVRPDIGASQADIEQFISGLLGKSTAEAQRLGSNYLRDFCDVAMRNTTMDKQLAFSEWMANSIASQRSEPAYRGLPRFQRFLDQAAAMLLSQAAQKLMQTPKATLTSDARLRHTYENMLLSLYRMTDESRNHALSDDASRLLEYVLYGGAAGKYQEYADYLKLHNLIPPATLTGGGWTMRNPGTWFSPYTTDCEMRLTQGAAMNETTIATLHSSTIVPHLNAAKAAPW